MSEPFLFAKDEDKTDLVAEYQKKLAELEIAKKQRDLTKPITMKVKGKGEVSINPGDLTHEQKQALGAESRSLNKRLVDMRQGLSQAASGTVQENAPPSEGQVVSQLTAYGLSDEQAQAVYGAAVSGDRATVIGGMMEAGKMLAGSPNAAKTLGALARQLDTMAAQKAAERGDTRGPLSVIESDLVMRQQDAKLKQDQGTGEGIDSRVIDSAGWNGTRAFTNIGTKGGQIQEIVGDDRGLVEVIRRRDGSRGFVPRDRFDPDKFVELTSDMKANAESVAPGTPVQGPTRPPVQDSMPKRPMNLTPFPPSQPTGLPGEGLMNRGMDALGLPQPGTMARLQYPDIAGEVSRMTGLPTNAQIGESIASGVGGMPGIRDIGTLARGVGNLAAAQGGVQVRDKITGQTFSIPREMYNPNLFDLLPMGERSAFTNPLGF